MFGKLLRLIFMEKDARARYEKRADQARKAAAAKPKAKKKDKAKTPSVTIPEMPRKGGKGAAADPDEVDVGAMIRDAVSEAERLLDAEKAAVEGTGVSAGANRRELVQAAMAVHRSKQTALGGLDLESRARLRALAEVMMGGNMPGGKGKK